MKTKNFLSLLAIVGILFFASCKKDDPTPLSKEEATAALNSVNTDYSTIRGQFEGSTAAAAQEAISNLNLPFNAPKKAPAKPETFKQDVFNALKSAYTRTKGGGFDINTIDFNFPEYVGTWTYNSSTFQFDHTSTPSDKVVILFPFNGSATNNATLTYSDYLTGTYNDGTSNVTYCKQLKAKVDIVGQTNPVMSWVYTSSQAMTETSMNASASFVYNLGDFTQTQSATINLSVGLTSITASASMLFEVKLDGAIVFSTSADMTMSGSQNNYTMVTNAQFRIMDIIIKWAINANNNTNFDGDPSTYMQVSVWTAGGAKVADVVFVYDGVNLKWVPYLKYADGTQEKVTDRFGSDTTPGTLAYEITSFIDSIMSLSL
jgi:hypothetical protein